MRSITLSLIVCVLTLFWGCSDNYHVMMRNWVGTDEGDLTRGWGKPVEKSTAAGSIFYVYKEDGGAPSGCTTTFKLVDGVVDSFDYDGEGCVGDFYTHSSN